MSRLSKGDPTSFSEPENVVTRHVDLYWDIDFDRKVIHGVVLMKLDVVVKEINQLVLDVDDLEIKEVAIKCEEGDIPLKFIVSEQCIVGAKLTIDLPPSTSGSLLVAIAYDSSETASALEWLKPEQTLGKTHPYMYSQCANIMARSIVPCQDTGAVKFTFRAEVTHPADLTALLGGNRVSSENGKTIYEQCIPIPAYLLGIAVGPLVSRTIGPISKVWCEEALVDECAEEFSETPQMIAFAEEICGPYLWKVYDILVLPPNYYHSGMENPCLTFVTQTLLTGDKSLAYIVAHEIAHSWTGNLVTNRNLEHFWVNEGFTMFLEGKIVGRMFGSAVRDFHAIQFLSDLQDCIDDQFKNTPELTKMVADMTGLHPNDTYSMLPYVKGQNFLRYLEDLLGGPSVFEPFLRYYIEKFKYKSIDSDDVKACLYEYFSGKADEKLAEVDWNAWFYGEGGLPILPNYDTSLSDTVYQLVDIWSNKTIEDIKNHPDLKPIGLQVSQLIKFLSVLVQQPVNVPITEEWIRLLEETYGFAGTRNYEIKHGLCRLYIKGRLINRLDQVLEFANISFVLRYVRPIYRALNEWPEAKPKAVANFLNVKDQMWRCVVPVIYHDLELEREAKK